MNPPGRQPRARPAQRVIDVEHRIQRLDVRRLARTRIGVCGRAPDYIAETLARLSATALRSRSWAMVAGELYDPTAPEIQADQAQTMRWLARYNSALGQPERWHDLLLEHLGAVGAGTIIRPPFYCDYGFNIRIGAGVFIRGSEKPRRSGRGEKGRKR